jgi:membrane protein YdbS with pleckstrin-like domain
VSIARVLRWLVIAIVLVVAVSLLDVIVDLASWLLEIAVPVLLVLLLVAVVLRFFGYWRNERPQ